MFGILSYLEDIFDLLDYEHIRDKIPYSFSLRLFKQFLTAIIQILRITNIEYFKGFI